MPAAFPPAPPPLRASSDHIDPSARRRVRAAAQRTAQSPSPAQADATPLLSTPSQPGAQLLNRTVKT